MSRIIFEGNTTERFGELYPKPFIEEIRVFDNEVEADISFYFQTEEDATIEELLSSMNGYRLYSGFGNNSDNDYVFSEFDISPDPFYNSDGDKFIKIMITRTFPIREITSDTYLFACSTINDVDTFQLNPNRFISMMEGGSSMFSDDLLAAGTSTTESGGELTISQIDLTERYENLKKKSSDLSFEKVFNEDGTLDSKRKILYIKPDGNAYFKTPLRSLDREYRTVDVLNHQQIISIISNIIQPTIGSIAESDLISTTLQENRNNPNLLLILQRNINNFSNKSTATAIGTLYGQLVDQILDFDNTLRSSEILQKRLFVNKKIVDLRRTNVILSGDSLPITSINTNYIHMPFITRRIELRDETLLAYTAVPGGDYQQGDFLVKNDFYLFFDYEKNLHKESEISRLFNPYNIMQIFGVNSLNKYYQVKSATVSRVVIPEGIEYTNHKIVYNGFEYLEENVNTSRFDIYAVKKQKVYNDNDRLVTIYSHMEERAFDTFRGLDDYRMKFYKILDFQSISEAEEPSESTVIFEIQDETLKFYDLFIKQKMQSLNTKINEYATLSEEFCAFNNLDNVFNDFFIDYIKDYFSEPYPWEEGVLYYYLMNALIQASWENGDVTRNRKSDGTLIDLDAMKTLAIVKSNQISPENGKLTEVLNFAEQFKSLYETVFEVGSALDNRFDLYGVVGTFDIDTDDMIASSGDPRSGI